MKRSLRFALVIAVALAIVPFLPLYIERTMVRSMHDGGSGDSIGWGWTVRSLSSYWSDYRYFRPEQEPALWLGVNVALAFVYALVIAFVVDRLLARRGQRRRAQ